VQNKDTHWTGTFRVKERGVGQEQSGKRKIEQELQRALKSWKEEVLAFIEPNERPS
jgi:hypothetical protein